MNISNNSVQLCTLHPRVVVTYCENEHERKDILLKINCSSVCRLILWLFFHSCISFDSLSTSVREERCAWYDVANDFDVVWCHCVSVCICRAALYLIWWSELTCWPFDDLTYFHTEINSVKNQQERQNRNESKRNRIKRQRILCEHTNDKQKQ